MTFNLVDAPWIPVLYANGDWKRVGIRVAFEDAGRIRQIAATNPMDRVAVLRFLLAVLYWCKGNPLTSKGPDTTTPDRGFPSEWFDKLDQQSECFNLLGDGTRFFQYSEANRQRSITELLQELPTGNNFWHFRHTTDNKDELCLPCCTLGLLRLPLFSVSGLPGLESGINGTPPIYVLRIGRTLKETLCANWSRHDDIGEPSWTHQYERKASAKAVPLLGGLTALARRVWLSTPDHRATCAACGDMNQPVVRTCAFQSAGTLESASWDDPHVLYEHGQTRTTAKASDLTKSGKFRMDRPWPDLTSRIAASGKFRVENESLRLLLVGFATDKAKNVDVWERHLALPAQLEPPARPDAIDEWAKQTSNLERSVAESKRNQFRCHFSHFRPHLEHEASNHAADFFLSAEEAWHKAAEPYVPMMRALAASLASGFTVEAFERRETLEKLAPKLPSKRKPGGPRKAKEGDGK